MIILSEEDDEPAPPPKAARQDDVIDVDSFSDSEFLPAAPSEPATLTRQCVGAGGDAMATEAAAPHPSGVPLSRPPGCSPAPEAAGNTAGPAVAAQAIPLNGAGPAAAPAEAAAAAAAAAPAAAASDSDLVLVSGDKGEASSGRNSEDSEGKYPTYAGRCGWCTRLPPPPHGLTESSGPFPLVSPAARAGPKTNRRARARGRSA